MELIVYYGDLKPANRHLNAYELKFEHFKSHVQAAIKAVGQAKYMGPASTAR